MVLALNVIVKLEEKSPKPEIFKFCPLIKHIAEEYESEQVLFVGVKSVGMETVRYDNDWFVALDKGNGDSIVSLTVDWPNRIIC